MLQDVAIRVDYNYLVDEMMAKMLEARLFTK